MKWPGHLYVDLRRPISVVRIDRVMLCAKKHESDLYEVTDVLNQFSYTVDGHLLSDQPISDLEALNWMKST
jgi:hypothetical protein